VPEARFSGSGRWVHRTGAFDLSRPLLMGILNVTPDSFSDGGLFLEADVAVRRAEALVAEGAGLIDVGGESTRPGARPVTIEEEIERVVPVVRAVKQQVGVPVSVDTRRSAVAAIALSEGADIVNDVSALADPPMAEVVAEYGAGLVLMHMRGTPETMQNEPWYGDVVAEVTRELAAASAYACRAGIAAERIVLDPGIGFGKTAEHNLELIAHLDTLAGLGHPVLLGASRKAFLGTLTGQAEPSRRAVATAAACVVGLLRGARIFRVHDVGIVREALQVAEALRTASPASPSSC
jgi:dihydropteroate synthase